MGTREGDIEWSDKEREILVLLSQTEIVTKAKRISEIHAEIQAIDNDMKRIVKGKKGRMEELRSELASALRAVTINREPRTVMVKEMLDYKRCVVETWFHDEKVDERTMDPAERQLAIDDAIKPKVRKAKQNAFDFQPGDQTAGTDKDEEDDELSPQIVDNSHLDAPPVGGDPVPTESVNATPTVFWPAVAVTQRPATPP